MNWYLTLVVVLSGLIATAEPRVRPVRWAQPVLSERLKNWYQLDEKVYRSAQPSARGFAEVLTLGITNVLNLRDHHSDADEAKGKPLVLYRIKTEAGDLNLDQVVAALRTIKNAKGPILVHCWQGSDRTGLVCAMYRMVFHHWTKDEAVDEMVNGGYGYHTMYRNLADLIRQTDVEALRTRILAP